MHARARTGTLLAVLLVASTLGGHALPSAVERSDAADEQPMRTSIDETHTLLRLGDRFTYEDVGNQRRLDVTLQGEEVVLAGDGRLREAVLVTIQETEGSAPRLVQALDPETGRVFRVVNQCAFFLTGTSTCDDDWVEVWFYGWDLPGLFGTAGILHDLWTNGSVRREAALPTGPATIYYDVHREYTESLQVNVTVPSLDNAQGDPLRYGLTSGHLLVTGTEPVPLRMRALSPGTHFAFAYEFRLAASERGDGKPLGIGSASLGAREALDGAPRIVPHDGFPIGETPAAWILDPWEAARWAERDPGLARYLSNHPDAAPQRVLGYAPRSSSVAGLALEEVQLIEQDQAWSLVYAEPGSSEGWRVEVERYVLTSAGAEVRNTTSVVESEPTSFGVGAFPVPADPAMVRALEGYLERFETLPGLGSLLAWRWSTYPDAYPAKPTTRLVASLLYTDVSQPCDDEGVCLSLSRTPALHIDLERGLLGYLSIPVEALEALDDQGLPRPATMEASD